jgi:hypothetical protein
VPIASNANPSASTGQHDARNQNYNADLLHGKYDFASYDATAPRFGFKKNRCFLKSLKRGVVVAPAPRRRATWQRTQRLDAARRLQRFAPLALRYCTIFSFAASAKTSST